MPTASELLDNRAIPARIHRPRHPSGISRFDSDEEDGDNPLVPARESQNVIPHNYFPPIRHDEPMEEPNDSNDESENPTNVVEVTEQISAPRSPRGGRGEIGGRERARGGGKWPRQKYLFNSSSVLKPAYRKQKCEAENCVHQYGSSCVDILLQPHLYPHISKSKGLVASSNPLLEYCLGGAGQLKDIKQDSENEEQLPPLLAICSSFSSASNSLLMPNTSCFKTIETSNNTAKENELDNGRTRTLENNSPASYWKEPSVDENELATNVATNNQEQINTCENQSNTQVYTYLEGQLICQAESGCDINVQNSSGFTALHFLINGCSKENFHHVLRAVSLLIRQSGISVSLEDIKGNTPFNAIQSLLHRGLYRQSFLIAKCLLQNSNCDVNHVNLEGRSLLSYSVCHGDNSIDLSRLLLNNGAKIFPTKANDLSTKQYENKPVDLETERHQSAFTWFLRSVMETYSLRNTEETVRLICQGMAEEVEGSSGNLKNHVLSTMVHVGKYGNRKCVAPIFVELKKQMSVYWSLPQPLTYHCLKTIRKSLSLRPKNDPLSQKSISTTSSSTETSTLSSYQLNLPSRIMSYLQLN